MVAPSQEIIFKAPRDLTIRTAKTLQVELLDCLRKHENTTAELPADYSADLSFVQLVEALRLYAALNGKVFDLSRPADGVLLDVLRRSGFIEGMSPVDRQFWLHQGETQ